MGGDTDLLGSQAKARCPPEAGLLEAPEKQPRDAMRHRRKSRSGDIHFTVMVIFLEIKAGLKG